MGRWSLILILTLQCIHADFVIKTSSVRTTFISDLIDQVFHKKIQFPQKIIALSLRADTQEHLILKIQKYIDELSNKKPNRLLEKKISNKVITINYTSLHEEAIKNLEESWTTIIGNKNESSMLCIPETNQLIIRGTDDEIKLFEKFINTYDCKPRKIKLDFIFIASEIDFNFGFGVNWSGIYNRLGTLASKQTNFGFAGTGGALTDIPTPTEPISSQFGNLFVNPLNFAINLFDRSLQAISQANTLDAQPNPILKLPIVFGGPDLNTRRLNLLINANEEESRLETIAKPTVITNDHELTKIFIGQEVPFYTKIINSINDTATNISSLEYQNVGTSIQAKTMITDDNLVYIDLFVEFAKITSGSVGTDSSGIMLNPPVLEVVKLQNNFIVENGQTVMITGTETETSEQAQNDIPYIHKVPLIGKLFTAKASRKKSIKKIIFITTTILDD